MTLFFVARRSRDLLSFLAAYTGWLAVLLLSLGLLAPSGTVAQTSLQPIPPLSARVIDTTGTLDPAQRQALESKLDAFEKSKGTQIVVLMIPSTQPEDLTDYTQRVGDLWKIGRKDIGDGLLVIVAKNDRTVRVATAKTLEGVVPDLAARQVIERAITPRFREGDFAGGLSGGLDQLMALISKEKLPEPTATARDTRATFANMGFQWLDFAAVLFFATPFVARGLGSVIGRKLGSLVTGFAVGLLAWLLTASLVVGVLATLAGAVFALASSLAPLGRRGAWGHTGPGGLGGFRGSDGFRGSGGFGGGGFSSGGGGDFGGGGASGRW